MPSWWGKLSSKEDKKKASKESLMEALHRKLKASDEKSNSGLGGSLGRIRDIISRKGSQSRLPSGCPSPSSLVTRCQSFAERSNSQPLPLPGGHRLAEIARCNSNIMSSGPEYERSSKKSLVLPLPKSRCAPDKSDLLDVEGNFATESVTSDSSIDSDDQSDSRLLSPLTSDYENGNRTAANSPGSKHKDHSPTVPQKKSREVLNPADLSLNNQILSTSPKKRPVRSQVQNIQIPPRGIFYSAPDSSLSSPSRSPMRAYGQEQAWNCGMSTTKSSTDVTLLGSGQCSSPCSGHNSGHNSVGGDMSGQLFWPNSRCSPECSPIPSPKMTSPGPSSRIQSGAVTPLHPRAGGHAESPTGRMDEGKQHSHRLPLPPLSPLTILNTCPFSPAYSAATSPSLPRSPNRAENLSSPGSRWKKGRLLGRGSFGHVYLGFNSESGEMCAMKEVTLVSDDTKSKENAQQLGQEILLLSRLRHPNIVQYLGSETIDDKLYIYLEYVSGGSIYKLLQDYGQFGECAIRNYTQQILSGLVYLHNKNTVHRDIKGANILVDPNGRVKVADFGMAKHITGQSSPLSLKGSPYWMAPEVIRNANGCSLAVDIWSLGCTVLEMATSKPPWSQYEGVAAMFKIGNSKELPAIPDHLSEEGKDFVRQCLQRNPLHRPTAAQLLEHPFIKNTTAPPERPVYSPDSSPGVTISIRAPGIGDARYFPSIDLEIIPKVSCRGNAVSGFSDAHTPRNLSCPVSPIGSPHLHPRSPQHLSGRMSPSPISSPHTASGSSTPLTGGGNGAIPFHHQQQHPIISPRSPNNFYSNAQRTPQASHTFWEMSGDLSLRDLQDGKSVLAEHVSQQLLRERKPSLDLNPSLTAQNRANGR